MPEMEHLWRFSTRKDLRLASSLILCRDVKKEKQALAIIRNHNSITEFSHDPCIADPSRSMYSSCLR